MDEGLSNKELRWGYWFFLHHTAMRRLVALILAVIGFTSLAYSGWQFVDMFASRQADEETMRLLVQTKVNTADYFARTKPQPIVIGMVTAVPDGPGTYALIAQVKNPNALWGVASLPYVFQLDSLNVTSNSYLLPLEDRYLVNVGVKLPKAPTQVKLAFADIGWRRVDSRHQVVAPSFAVTGEHVSYTDGVGTQLSFTLENTGAYGYWQAGVIAVLMRGGAPVAVGRQFITNVESGQKRTVEFTWPRAVGTPDQLIVKPEVNVFDTTVVKPL